jgi:hypothetical protein
MAKKILSFEEYAANKNLDSAEEITESCDACGEDPCVCESEEVENTEEVEDTEEVENDDESDDDESDDDDDESDDDDDDDDEDDDDDKGEETLESCSEQLKKCYEYAIKEACDYDKDDYPDHTLEGYLKENAALVAALSASALEQAHAELKDDELTIEVYESCLNAMKESYNKKIDELKEAWSSK